MAQVAGPQRDSNGGTAPTQGWRKKLPVQSPLIKKLNMEWEVCLSLQGGQRKENVTLRLDYSDAEWTFHRVRVGGQSMTCRFLTGGTHLKVAAFDCGSDEEELASVATAMAEGEKTMHMRGENGKKHFKLHLSVQLRVSSSCTASSRVALDTKPLFSSLWVAAVVVQAVVMAMVAVVGGHRGE